MRTSKHAVLLLAIIFAVSVKAAGVPPEAAAESGVPIATEHAGGMFGFVFTDVDCVQTFDQVAAADIDRFRKFYHGMLAEGVYLAPSAFEAGFVSAAHGAAEIDQTLSAARKVMATL